MTQDICTPGVRYFFLGTVFPAHENRRPLTCFATFRVTLATVRRDAVPAESNCFQNPRARDVSPRTARLVGPACFPHFAAGEVCPTIRVHENASALVSGHYDAGVCAAGEGAIKIITSTRRPPQSLIDLRVWRNVSTFRTDFCFLRSGPPPSRRSLP